MSVNIPFVGREYKPVCRYCGGKLIAAHNRGWRVHGDGGKPCPESVAAGYPAHCPTPKTHAEIRAERGR